MVITRSDFGIIKSIEHGNKFFTGFADIINITNHGKETWPSGYFVYRVFVTTKEHKFCFESQTEEECNEIYNAFVEAKKSWL